MCALTTQCFDGVEGNIEKWRPAVALHKSKDHPSTSMIFAEQTLNLQGKQAVGVGKQLFGHGCAWTHGALTQWPHTRHSHCMCVCVCALSPAVLCATM